MLSQVALEFLEQSARCTHAHGAYVEVTLADGVTRFRGGGGDVAAGVDVGVLGRPPSSVSARLV